MVAAYVAIDRLMHPQKVSHLWAVAVAALVGFAGNELVARYRIRVGPQAQSYGPSAGRHVAVPRKSTAIQAKQ